MVFSLTKIRSASIILLSLPVFIFFLTWLRPVVGIPATILLGVAVYMSLRPRGSAKVSAKGDTITINKTSLIILGAIILVWLIICGQGRFFTQTYDHFIRNAIFRDLINYSWPVRYEGPNDESLVYYIGYWLVPSLVGKLVTFIAGFKAGYLAGRIALVIWGLAFIFITILLIMFKLRKTSLKSILVIACVFILFSGMDNLGMIILRNDSSLESWAKLYVYTSMTTQLMDVFNQSVPAWLATALVINEKDERSYALIGLLLLSTSPLPLFGLATYLLYLAVRNLMADAKVSRDKLINRIKTIASPINIISVIVLFPIFYIYYDNNIAIESGITVSTDNHFVQTSWVYAAVVYVLFVLLEFAVLLLLVMRRENRSEAIFTGSALAIIPFLHVGWSTDFCMRASIPMLFLLMVMLMDYFLNYSPLAGGSDNSAQNKTSSKRQNLRFGGVLMVSIIGALTAVMLLMTSITGFIYTKGESATNSDQLSGLADLELPDKGNCVGIDSSSTRFFTYLGRN